MCVTSIEIERESSSGHLSPVLEREREKSIAGGKQRGEGRKGGSFKKESNSGSPTFSLYIAQSPRTNRRRVTAPSPPPPRSLLPAPLRAARPARVPAARLGNPSSSPTSGAGRRRPFFPFSARNSPRISDLRPPKP